MRIFFLLFVFGLMGFAGAAKQPPSLKELGACIANKYISGLQGAFYCRLDSGENWEAVAKVGPHADVMVRLGNRNDKLVFWRGSSYLPYWQSASGKWYVDEVVARKGDGNGLMHDKINQYSHVRIIESNPARAVILWRYVPDFDNPTLNGWAEEYFTVYPDGVCFRAIRKGTKTLEQWENPANTIIKSMLFTEKGVSPLPRAWSEPIALSLGSRSAGSYDDMGYDKVKGCYNFKCKKNGLPGRLNFRVVSSARNPAVVVRSWGDADVKVTIDGKAFKDYRKGYAKKMDNDDLVLWLGKDFKAGSSVVVEPVSGSAPVVRAPVRDPYSSKVPLFPESSVDPGPFGAYYTTLKYFKEWDEPWRVGEYADIVIQFDKSTDRFIFWRGTSNVPHWVNERNVWYENEFCERRAGDAGLPSGCAEPMQDHESRYSYARIIYSHNARVIVHWRYAPCDGNYDHPFVDQTGWGDWVDEYYYVYPDETCVRKATLYTSAPHKFNEWHEAIPLVNPGMIPEDCIEMKAFAMANIEGKAKVYDFTNGFPPNKEFEDGLNILLVRVKGKSKPFAVVEPYGQWYDPVSRADNHRFNHYDDWPGWPAKYRRKDWERNPVTNYREFWRFLPSHSSLMHYAWDDYENDLDGPIKWKCKIMLNGMTNVDDVTALIPLAKYWENPPLMRVTGYGFSGGAFDKAEKAYKIDRRVKEAKEVKLELFASADSPLLNPCFVVEGWPENAKANLTINGQSIKPGPDFRQGIEKTADGVASLVVWIRKQSTSPLNIGIRK